MVKNTFDLVSLGADIGAAECLRLQKENQLLRERIAGLEADREALVSLTQRQHDVIAEASRIAAYWRKETLARFWRDALVNIPTICDDLVRR